MRKISEILKNERKAQNLALEDVEKTTKIKKEFLRAIEEGKFHQLPSESYALGFVKNYASFLGVNSPEVVPLFRREYKAEKVEVIPHYTKNQPKKRQKFYFSYKTILAGVGAFILLGYILFQFHSFFVGPKLSIDAPQEGAVVKDNIVEVKGKTDPYATVLVEGEEVYVQIDGTFQKSLYLFSGEKNIKIVAKDRNGKQTTAQVSVQVQ